MSDTAYRPRNLYNVIGRMIPLIPEDTHPMLKDKLQEARDDMVYTPPEMMGQVAQVVAEILYRQFGPAGTVRFQWALKMLAIWMAEDAISSDYKF